MQTFQIEVNDNMTDKFLKFLENFQDSVRATKLNCDDLKLVEHDLWTQKELEYIAKIDLSTPLEDNEDYSKW